VNVKLASLTALSHTSDIDDNHQPSLPSGLSMRTTLAQLRDWSAVSQSPSNSAESQPATPQARVSLADPAFSGVPSATTQVVSSTPSKPSKPSDQSTPRNSVADSSGHSSRVDADAELPVIDELPRRGSTPRITDLPSPFTTPSITTTKMIRAGAVPIESIALSRHFSMHETVEPTQLHPAIASVSLNSLRGHVRANTPAIPRVCA